MKLCNLIVTNECADKTPNKCNYYKNGLCKDTREGICISRKIKETPADQS